MSALQALQNRSNKKNNYLVSDLKSILYKAQNLGLHITLFWIPAHKGIIGNERADEIAKEAANNGTKIKFKIPHTDLFKEATAACDRIFDNYKLNSFATKGKMYGNLYLDSGKKPWFYKFGLDRTQIVTTNRIRSDHYNLAFSLWRKNIVQIKYCHCGEGRENVNHIIFYCPLYKDKTKPLITYLKKEFPDSPINIFHILKTPNPKLCRLLCALFKSCQLQI